MDNNRENDEFGAKNLTLVEVIEQLTKILKENSELKNEPLRIFTPETECNYNIHSICVDYSNKMGHGSMDQEDFEEHCSKSEQIPKKYRNWRKYVIIYGTEPDFTWEEREIERAFDDEFDKLEE